MSSPSLLTIASVILVSLISLLGIVLFPFHEKTLKKYLLYLVSFSTGGLLGDVFLHMIPEIAEDQSFLPQALSLILLGIVLSFIVEKFIHWRHCHDMECGEHILPVGIMNLFGDGVHNFIDGVLIAGSYLVSFPVGVATTIAVALHEIPQEISDFSILIYSGFKRKKALFFNLLSALAALLGAVIVLLWSNALPSIGKILLPLAAGNFVYIAGADLIPELHKEVGVTRSLIQLAAMILGILLMYGLTVIEI